jgi:subtilisin family serine protease
MRSSSMNLRPILALLLCGLLLAACWIGGSSEAAAFGMGGFGRMRGFGRPAMGGGQWRRTPAPHAGGGRVVDRPSGRTGRRVGLGDRGPSRHHPFVGGITGGGAIGGGYNGRGGGGGSNGGGSGGGAPPQGDQRFVPDEVITAFAPNATPRAIDQIARRYDLTRLESQNFPLIGSSLYRWRIGGGRSVANAVRALGGESIVASVQPNYVFTLQEETKKMSAATPGDAAQYVLGKLQIEQAQKIATGKNVLVAVIDSEIDSKHPDLDGTIVKSFDAIGGDDHPHPHGTSIAGAIASHGKLLGIAPGIHLLAVHAFDDTPGQAKGTSFAIDKGLQWAADNGARVVNMSFAGPADPSLHRMLAAAYDKGLVLVAAAGNAGPQSEPLYPAADPDVIAVTATNSNDQLFKSASRGRYIAVAAPGGDILVLAPGDAYQITTGTSIAAAHVSGIAALLLEHKPSLKPSDIRAVLITTAKRLGPPVPDSDFGAGLVDAYRAVMSLDRNSVGANDGGGQARP